jgi:digeranylgeranylglycerophospholipid reductase
MTQHFDCVVIGAGPGGSSAAYTAAQHGLSVLLLEEHAQAGKPVACAEGLSRSTIKDFLEIKDEWIAHPLAGAVIRGPHGEEFTIEYPGCGWILDRKVFDAALAERAAQAGAIFKTSAKAMGIEDDHIMVNEKGTRKKYRFSFVIGADGVASRVGPWLGIDTRLSLDEIEVCAEYYMENIKVRPHYAYLLFGEKYAPGGYAWIFPKSSTSANIGLGISPRRTQRTAVSFLDRWVSTEFPGGTIRRKVYGGVPAKILTTYSGMKFYLVGDAARLTDPLSGAGIANSIKSGIFAGQSVFQRMNHKKETYCADIEREILKEVRYHQKVRNVYMKLSDRDYVEVFNIARKFFEGTKVRDINIKHIVKYIIHSSPRLLWLARRLIF